jgi:outer membrane protein TolC
LKEVFMCKKILIPLITLFFCVSPFVCQEPDTLNLTLQDALSIAMKNNFDISIARIGHESSDATLSGSKGIYDPSLSLSLNSSVNRQPTTSSLQAGAGLSTYQLRQDSYNLGLSQLSPWGQTFSLDWSNTRSRSNSSYSLFNPTYSSNFALSTSIPLLKGFGVTNTNKFVLKAKLDRQAADYTYSRLLRDSLYDVESSYWNLVYSMGQFEVTKKALEVAKEFQKETKARIAVGTLAPIEQVSADAQVASREEELITAESVVDNSEDILKIVLGVRKDNKEWNMKIIPADSPNTAPVSYEEEKSIQSALDRRDEIKELETTLQKTKIDTKTAKTDMLPTLNLDSSLSYAGSVGDYYLTGSGLFVDQNFGDAWDQIHGKDYKSWAVGLAFHIPIGNRTQRFAYQNYRLMQNEAEISLEKTRQNIISEVRSTLRNVRNSEKRIAAAEANLKLQKEKLDAEKKKYDNGLSTSFNVLSYQNDFLSAETSLLKAKIDHQLALSALERAEGRYLEARGIELDVPLYSQEKK